MTQPTSPAHCSEHALAYGRQRSAIRELFEYGNRVAEEVGRENVFDFSLGNPSVPPPDAVYEAFERLLANTPPLALHGYTSAPGDPGVRRTIADALNARHGTSYNPNNVFMTCGAAAALASTFRALTIDDEPNEFVALAPYFPEYNAYVSGQNAELTVVPPTYPDFGLSIDAIEAAIGPHTRAVIVNSPNNPTGRLYPAEELRALGEMLDRASDKVGHTIYIVSDEPYRELVYDGKTTPFIPNLYRNTIVCYSYSKVLSMPGNRIGYVLVPSDIDHADDIYDAVGGAARLLGYVCAPALIQRVIGECVDVHPDLAPYDANRKLLYDGLTDAGYRCVVPEGAFYMFVEAPGGDAQAFSDFARLNYNLLTVPSESFGCPGYLRISYCVTDDQIRRALPRFKRCLEEWNARPA